MRAGPSAYVAVGVGGVAGSLMRWAASLAFAPVAGWPWGTLVVNVAGSFAIGMLAAHPRADHPLARHFAMTGFCGGFTTFSAFGLETLTLFQTGDAAAALGYAAATALSCLAAVALGDRLARRF